MVPQEFLNTLKKHNKILLLASKNWSGDDICSILALKKILQALGKEVTAIGPENKPSKFSFLKTQGIIDPDLPSEGSFIISLDTQKNKVEKIQYRMLDDEVEILVIPQKGNFSSQDVSFRKGFEDIDMILTLGVESFKDIPKIYEKHTEIFSQFPVLNLSRSFSNEFFGDLNWVDTKKSSLCEMVYEMCQKDEELKSQLTPEVTTLLLTGLVANTESFLDRSTNKNSLYTASDLQRLGADQSEVIEQLFKKKKLSTLKAWGKVLEKLEIDPLHKIAWSSIDRADFFSAKASFEDIVDFNDELVRHVKDSDLTVLFIEKDEDTQIQIRSNNPLIDFEDLSSFLGGAGKKTKHGRDITVRNKKIIEVEYDFLELLLAYQKERLSIPSQEPLQKMNITQKVQKETKEKKSSPKDFSSLEKIPFEIISGSEKKEWEDLPTQSPPPPKKEEKVITPHKKLPPWLEKE